MFSLRWLWKGPEFRGQIAQSPGVTAPGHEAGQSSASGAGRSGPSVGFCCFSFLGTVDRRLKYAHDDNDGAHEDNDEKLTFVGSLRWPDPSSRAYMSFVFHAVS